MVENQQSSSEIPEGGLSLLIAEMDGTMLPIVEVVEKQGEIVPTDRRKLRRVGWREARLCLARRPESITPYYRATLRGVEQAGEALRACFVEAGGGKKTDLHCVGDAAQWIINQVEAKFPQQATYLIDFFHMSEYLSEAAQEVEKENHLQWLNQQQERMKENRVSEVLEIVKAGLSSRIKEGEGENRVRACERYLANHLQYFDYKRGLEKELPIGSGEIESGHKWVIQKRLKMSGAWWKEENAEKMLALRVVRANDEWQSYWDEVRQAAA